MRRLGGKFALGVGSLCFVLLVCEGLLRVCGIPVPQVYDYVPARYVGWTVAGETNSHGYRDQEWVKSPDIMVLGDSFVYGHGMPLELRFDAYLRDAGYSVVTIACPGWGTEQELKALEYWSVQLLPGSALLVWCGNDPVNDRTWQTSAPKKYQGREWYQQILKHSHVYRHLVRQLFWIKKRYEPPGDGLYDPQTGVWLSDQDIEDSIRKLRSVPNLWVTTTNPELSEPFMSLRWMPTFEGMTNDLEQTFLGPRDGHWNREAHEAFARSIMEHIL